MDVFLVISGDYEERGVDSVWPTKEEAEAYIKENWWDNELQYATIESYSMGPSKTRKPDFFGLQFDSIQDSGMFFYEEPGFSYPKEKYIDGSFRLKIKNVGYGKDSALNILNQKRLAIIDEYVKLFPNGYEPPFLTLLCQVFPFGGKIVMDTGTSKVNVFSGSVYVCFDGSRINGHNVYAPFFMRPDYIQEIRLPTQDELSSWDRLLAML